MSDLSRDLKRAIDRAEEGAGTMPAREAVKLRPADWHAVCRIAREAASRLQAPAVAEGGWQPIETAPGDGADVLCGAWVRGIWRTGVSIVSSAGVANNWDWLTPATHWCPLPAPAALRTGGSE